TVTEIYDYLRLLYARIGIPHCYNCGKPIAQQTSGQIVDNIYKEDEKTKIQILAPVVKDRKGENHKLLEDLKKKGFVRVRVDGEIVSLDDDINMDKNKKHSVEVVVDRLVIRYDVDFKRRLADSVETALELGEGLIIILYQENDENYEKVFSEHFACTECGINFEEISPRTFSFNSPHGACSTCNGLGSKLEIDTDLVIPDKSLSLEEGAILPWSKSKKRNNYYTQMLKAVGDHYDFSMDTPFNELPKKYQNVILYGSSERVDFTFRRRNRMHHVRRKFEGVVKRMERLFMDTKSNYMRGYIGQFMSDRKCPACNGTRLRPESRSVTVGDKSISTVSSLPIKESKNFFEELKLTEMEGFIAKEILKEINERLKFLANVGLDYITLDRSSGTLSGGEAQRIRLATQIGSGLVGVLYILDEPSIGLHQRDNARLIDTLKKLRDIGNTLIIVEHDEETILSADHVIDIGPGAGEHGGRITAFGNPQQIMDNPDSITGRFLSRKDTINIPDTRTEPNGKYITVIGARQNNLQNIDVKIPLGVFTCITGVSGSGKSTLINDVLYKGLSGRFNKRHVHAGKHDDILGTENIDKVIIIDQSPIGRTPRSNPATYTGVFTYIREIFSESIEAKKRGYKPG
ncbi:MAG: excinuclease ABC subunit UvrA, partial [Methanobacterium sp.]